MEKIIFIRHNETRISKNDWIFNCTLIDRERFKEDAYVHVEWDCHGENYEIKVILTYSAEGNDYDYLVCFNTCDYPNLDIFHVWNECVKGATDIAEKYGIELILDEPIERLD